MANTLLNGENSFLLSTGTRQQQLIQLLLFKYCIDGSSQRIKTIKKKDVILSLHADNIILYAEISKEPTKKATRIRNYNKVAGYKINKLIYMPTENQQFKN